MGSNLYDKGSKIKESLDIWRDRDDYGYSTEHDYFKLHQLLYIKSFVLLNFEARTLMSENETECAKRTSFEKRN